MRKIDIERSRDYYKKTLNIALNTMAQMTRAFENTETHFIERIKELETKLEQYGKDKKVNPEL